MSWEIPFCVSGNGERSRQESHLFAPLASTRRRRRSSKCKHQHHHDAPCIGQEETNISDARDSRSICPGKTPRIALKFTLQILLLGSAASIFAIPIDARAAFVPPSTGRARPFGSDLNKNRASLFVSIQLPSTVGRGAGKGKDGMSSFSHNYSTSKGPHDDSQPLILQPTELLQKLASFSSNISRHRMMSKKIGPRKKEGKDITKSNDDALIGACTSLVYFLRDETEKLSSSAVMDRRLLDSATIESMKQMLEMLLVQSLRATSEVGDFVLLTKLVYATVDFATEFSNKFNDPTASGTGHIALLSPRIFGEAISSLSKTKASTSKLKSFWRYFLHEVAGPGKTTNDKKPSLLTSPPSAYELNAMLSSLGSDRGKVSAAIKLYRQTVEQVGGSGMQGDAYTASVLFGILSDSIASNRNHVDSDGEGYMSPCWQWNEAMALLDTFTSSQLNNYAFAALLKVNERATEEYNTANARHNGVRCSMLVLERMKNDKISPDVVTCSKLMKTFDKGRNWKASVTLLDAMQQTSSKNTTGEDTHNPKKWSLPLPNTYTYSLAISTCARCNQREMALSLLDKMAASKNTTAADPNTWVYNAAILACAESTTATSLARSRSRGSGYGLMTAFDILEKMETDSSESEEDTSPDTVSYNTALSILDESSFVTMKESQSKTAQCNNNRLSKHDRIIDVVIDILDTMEVNGVSRDAITYYNAIMACKHNGSEDALAIFRKSLLDTDFIQHTSENIEEVGASTELKGRAAAGVVFVANAALSVIARFGDVHALPEVLSMLSRMNATLDAESIKHIIRTLGKIDDCEAILALLICLRGQSFANDILKDRYFIDILSNISEKSIPMIEEQVYSAAITSCLRHDELGMADQILLSMKKNGLMLNQRSLMEIISEYCRMAMTSSKEEFKLARLAKRQEFDNARFGIVDPIYITSRARAKAALAMLKAVDTPPPSLLSPVAKACCAAGLWQDARSVVRRMHRAAIREFRSGNQDGSSSSNLVNRGKFLDELPRLHRSLLKYCAKGGNITPALNIADDIQFLASQIRQHGKSLRGMAKARCNEPELVALSSRLLMDIPTPDNIPEADFSDAGAFSTILERPVGLTGQDWKLILIAASRGGHWKVCVGTLPFIRPYVKETHPMYARESFASSSHDIVRPSNRPSLERLNRKYDRIARALTAAILCFEARSQYAWAIRAIDDWIDWSGRRPRKEAVASACRILAKRHRGQEVLNMVMKVLNIPAIDNPDVCTGDRFEIPEYTYEKAIYTESINALHKSGLYEEADQLYAAGVSNGHLPWAVMQVSDSRQLRLDLHGMSAAVAHSAVRVSLQKEIIGSSKSSYVAAGNTWARDVMIITGRGRRSGERFRPVLRPEVQRMLTEEFYPPLGTSSIPGNMGALLVRSGDIGAWLSHQQKQKGERLLFVADMLRDISSGNRLEKAIERVPSRLERALLMKFKPEDSSLEENDDTEQL
mmetsp:Transcript_23764/g.57302  ORF Transcript_23764/g.57302 Transcript_23764/m.57302 type:complete len:1469 (+) Transcript_23764:151-4557(+)